jgi:PmbA protein
VTLEPLLRLLSAAATDELRACDWSLYASESRRLALGIKDRQIGNAHAPFSLTHACAARYLIVWSDGRVSRGSFERRQLEAEPREALAAARAAAYDDPDAAQVLGPASMPEVELHDPAAASIGRGDGSPLAARLAWIRRRVDALDLRTWSGGFAAAESSVRLITSAGLEASGRGTSFGWHITLDGEIGDGFSARRTDTTDEFEARLERLAVTARRLRAKARPMPGGVHPVILAPRVAEDLVLGTLLHHLHGSTVDHGEGMFRREQFGSDRPVLREDLSLRLDPLEPLKNGSYRFTVEGLPADRCVYVRSGRLVRPILDLKYARRLGLSPTPVPFDSDVLHLEGPERLGLTDAMNAAGGGALILSVLGLHTQDRSSGDFSLSAPQALRFGADGFEGGLRATLSGNLFDVLRDEALRLVDFEGEHTPGLLFPCRLDPK